MNAIALIKRHEGLRLKPYRCKAGRLTIGYGRNLDDNGISEQEATMMLMNDLTACIDDLQTLIPPDDSDKGLTLGRVRALLDMRFNLGAKGIRGFKRMWKWIYRGDWDNAAAEALDSDAARDLPKRYKAIADMLRKG